MFLRNSYNINYLNKESYDKKQIIIEHQLRETPSCPQDSSTPCLTFSSSLRASVPLCPRVIYSGINYD